MNFIVSFEKKITSIIGKNSSGKTMLFDVLRNKLIYHGTVIIDETKMNEIFMEVLNSNEIKNTHHSSHSLVTN